MKYLVSIIFLSMNQATYAATRCTDIPDQINVEETIANFDGSITYTHPRVSVDGSLIQIQGVFDGAAGFCAVLKQQFVTFKTTWASSGPIAALNVNGQLVRVAPRADNGNFATVLSKVTCR